MPRTPKMPKLLKKEIHNHHNVYILGAGFSVAAGLPVTATFLTKMREAHPWLDHPMRVAEAMAIADVFKLRKAAAAAAHRVRMDVENIEDLFSFASATEQGQRATNVVRAIAGTLDYCSLRQPLVREVRLSPQAADGSSGIPVPGDWRSHYRDKSSNESLFVSVYETGLAAMLGLVRPGPRTDNTIITFNYDLVVERALRKLNVLYSYGWRNKRAIYADDSVSPGGMPVLKLHGSVNWLAGAKQPTAYAEYEDVRKAGGAPLLVPPSWAKDFAGVLLDVWNEAVERLSTATRIVIIGFSMPSTDTHFKYLLSAGLRENVSLREILFITPDKAVPARAVEMFTEYAPVRTVDKRFENFDDWASIDRGLHRGIAFEDYAFLPSADVAAASSDAGKPGEGA